MPLTAKGEEIKKAMTQEYGEKRGEEVLYASKNSGAISGIDAIAAATTVHDSTLNWANGDYTLTKGPGEPGMPESAKVVSGVDATLIHERQTGQK